MVDDVSSEGITYPAADLSDLCVQYSDNLSELMDKNVPVTSRTLTDRPYASWYNDKIRQARQQLRQCERIWHKSRL